MPLTITDEELRAMNMDAREARIEFACRLYDADKLSKFDAARMAEMTRDEFNAELMKRGLPVIRYTEEDFDRDLLTLKRLEESGFWEKRR
jgi:predicted HTH domain antitoxin